MLNINNKEYKIISSQIRYVNSTHNKITGYSILIEVTFQLNNIKGYLCFYVDFFDSNDFSNIEDRTYIETPTDLDSKIYLIEIYDTEKFIDFIDSEVKIIFGSIVNNKIEIKVYIDDEYITLNYIGDLDIVNN